MQKIICGSLLFAGLLLAAMSSLAADQADKPKSADLSAIAVKTAPKIDGLINDAAWDAVADSHQGVLAGWRTLEGKLVPQQRIGYVCYDTDYLYVGMQAFTPDIYKLKAGANGSPFTGDCLEIHLKVLDGAYYQWGIDIEGTLGNGVIPAGTDSSLIKRASEFGDNFWSTEVAIPWKLLGITVKPGFRIAFNLAANVSYQGNEKTETISWGKSYMVRNAETVLELQ